MKTYITTSLLLSIAKEPEKLSQIEGEPYISDLVIAEVHNIEEPWREWVAKLLKEHPMLCVKVQKEELEFSRKYVYNKVLTPEEYCTGLHYYIGCTKGFDEVHTCNSLMAEKKEELDRINQHFNKKTTEVKLLKCTDFPAEELSRVRKMIARLCETQGEIKLLSAIRESVDFFFKEKELSLRRVEKI